jgi:hypothetical protein
MHAPTHPPSSLPHHQPTTPRPHLYALVHCVCGVRGHHAGKGSRLHNHIGVILPSHLGRPVQTQEQPRRQQKCWPAAKGSTQSCRAHTDGHLHRPCLLMLASTTHAHRPLPRPYAPLSMHTNNAARPHPTNPLVSRFSWPLLIARAYTIITCLA